MAGSLPMDVGVEALAGYKQYLRTICSDSALDEWINQLKL
jgi:predicted secreted protein